MNNQSVVVLAIGRAEKPLHQSLTKLREILKKDFRCYLLVNEAFKSSPAYRGNETPSFFEEVSLDFGDTELLKEKIEMLTGDSQVIVHCRMEEAIKDFQKIIPLLKNSRLPSVESLENCTEKKKMRAAMERMHPEICPKFKAFKTFTEFESSDLSNFEFPVIIKPNGLHSSYLVDRCEDYAELKQKIENAFSNIHDVYSREYGTGEVTILVEEFMAGDMYSVDAYVDANGGIFHLPVIRVTPSAEVGRDGFYCYRTKTSTPELNTRDIKDAFSCVDSCIESVGLRSSTAHIELYKTSSDWKIIEIGPRIGGDRQSLYMCAYGIDHYLNDLLIRYGIHPLVDPTVNNYAAGFNLYAKKEGLIQEIIGLEEIKKMESVIRFDLNTAVGKKSVFASNGGQFLADGIFCNSDEQKLEEEVEKMRETLKFKIDDEVVGV